MSSTPISRRIISNDDSDSNDSDFNEDISLCSTEQNATPAEEPQEQPVVLPIKRIPQSSDSSKPKAKRGRPRKQPQVDLTSVPISNASASNSTALPLQETQQQVARIEVRARTQLDEIDIALDHIARVKRQRTAAAYTLPLTHWKLFCDENKEEFDIGTEYPYTVGPPDLVISFFKNFVLKRTTPKTITIGSDVRTQISLRDENNQDQATLATMLENAPSTKDGRRKQLDLPIGIESVKQYKKALMALHEFQTQRRSITWPSPKDIQEVKDLIKEYEQNLVYDEIRTAANRAAHCVIRDSYKPGQLIKMLKDLWTSTDSRTHLRDMFSIAARHHMLLRDQNVRNLNFSDCFSTIIPRAQHRGHQQAVALVFSLHNGKTHKDGEVKFSCAMRHQIVFRCPFGAFSFYMYSMLQDGADFLKEETWQGYKVLAGQRDPHKGLSGSQQYNKTKVALAEQGINTSRVTHGGRHAGAMEAEALGIPFDLIKRGGGWKDHLGRLETHYLGKLPSQFARGMAGFWGKPFYLSRNSVAPSLELQQLVFPWIENIYGENNIEWKKECRREMLEFDENDDEDLQEDESDFEIIEETPEGEMSSRKASKAAKRPIQSSVDAAQRGFLKLLVRCRRIILQDAAVLLHYKAENNLVNTRPSSRNIFLDPRFKSFQQEVVAAINAPTPTNNRLQDFEELVPNIVDTNKEVSNTLSGISYQVSRSEKEENERFTRIQTSIQEQSNHNTRLESYLATISTQMQQFAYNQQLLMANQQLLSSQLQMLTVSNGLVGMNNLINVSPQTASPTATLPPPRPILMSPKPALNSTAFSAVPSTASTSSPANTNASVNVPTITISRQPGPSTLTIIERNNNSRNRSKQKGKGRWINYDPQAQK